ncbi:MAG: hypothetical protein ACR2QC_05780 [Gammaproteobacteria bacterium]
MKSDLVITPEQFKAALDAVLGGPTMKHRLGVCTAQTENSGKGLGEYTKIWDGSGDIYENLANRLTLVYNREHVNVGRGRLDAVFFHKDAPCPVSYKAGVWAYARLMSLVIEHENNPDSAYEEVGKLQQINAPLKALITYPRDGDGDTLWFDEYAKQLREWEEYVECSCPDFFEHQKFIVVLGWWLEKSADYEWDYRLYKKGGIFEKIK